MASTTTLTDARCEPKPVQAKHPDRDRRQGAATARLPAAARWADHWDMTGPDSPATWKAISDILDQRCAAIGRDPAEIRRSVHLMWPEEADPVGHGCERGQTSERPASTW